jgi:hypothetical protein
MKKRINLTIFLALALMLTACNNGISQAEVTNTTSQTGTATQKTETTTISTPVTTVSTPAFTLIPATASPRPTIEVVMTPDPIQLARWMEYEDALARKFVPSQGAVLCEWELLGRSGQEIFVWAFCQASGSIPTGMSAPAVIHLGSDGTVQNVEVPGDGSLYASDVRRLFPPYVREKIFARLIYVDRMIEHIYLRLEHPEPPLIVLSATSVP